MLRLILLVAGPRPTKDRPDYDAAARRYVRRVVSRLFLLWLVLAEVWLLVQTPAFWWVPPAFLLVLVPYMMVLSRVFRRRVARNRRT